MQENPQLVEQHIQEEVQSFRLLGPIPPFLATTCHTSPIGHIPKPNQPGQRLIVDLSAPAGASVNDAIHPDLCSLCYTSLDDATLVVQKLDRGVVLAKLDLKKAYRMSVYTKLLECIHRILTPRAAVLVYSPDLSHWGIDTEAIAHIAF